VSRRLFAVEVEVEFVAAACFLGGQPLISVLFGNGVTEFGAAKFWRDAIIKEHLI
jgi:hypothetical protein